MSAKGTSKTVPLICAGVAISILLIATRSGKLESRAMLRTSSVCLPKPSSAAMILVPGAVFDPAGRRIGYGGGYYDRYLAGLVEPARECAPDIGYAGGAHPTVPDTAERPLLVAPCFDLQVVASVPAEPHDISMDLILTEHREIVVRDRG